MGTKKVIDAMDDDLKEAIRRSLVDALPIDRENTKNKEDSKQEEDVEVKPMRGVPTVFPVGSIEVTAGNEHTQKALDTMDPKTKEALSRNLSECFARRASEGDS